MYSNDDMGYSEKWELKIVLKKFIKLFFVVKF